MIKQIQSQVKKVILSGVLYSSILMTYAQNTSIKWQASFGDVGKEAFTSVAPVSGGGYIVAGVVPSINNGDYGIFGQGADRKNDIGLVRLDEARNVLWVKRYGGSENDYPYAGIKSTKDGGYIIAGTTESSDGDVIGNHGNSDIWVLKLNSIGDTVWTKSYGGTELEEARAIEETSDGGYIIVGTTYSKNGDVKGIHDGTYTVSWGTFSTYDAWVLKLNSAGDTVWTKALGGSGNEMGFDIHQSSDGGYIVTGNASSKDGDFTGSGWHGAPDASYGFATDIFAAKLTTNGSVSWTKCYGGTKNESGAAIQQTTDGGYVVAGNNMSTDGDAINPKGGSGGDIWVLKINTDGSIKWEKSYGGIKIDQTGSIYQTKNGGYVIGGRTNSTTLDVMPGKVGTDYDAWVVQTDSEGAIKWQKTFGGTGSDDLCKIEQLSDGTFLVAAATTAGKDITTNSGSTDFWIARFKACPAYTSLTAEICEGGSYDFNGTVLTTAGEHTATLQTAGGCDSLVTLTLNVKPVPQKPVIAISGNTLTTGQYTSYQWLLNNNVINGATTASYVITEKGNYRVVAGNGNCTDTSTVVYQALASSDDFSLRGRYEWTFEIPNMGSQLSVHKFYADSIEYAMSGSAYTTSYNTIKENYYADEQRWVGVGKGGSIDKTGKYFVLFFKDLTSDGDSVLVYKHECVNKEEAYNFAYPASNAIADHGWNWYVKPASTTGIYDNTLYSVIKVYPNPVIDLLHIEVADASALEVTVSSVNGNTVGYMKTASGKADISVSELQAGVYIARIVAGDTTVVRKIIKQ